jgi:hypothetical protein
MIVFIDLRAANDSHAHQGYQQEDFHLIFTRWSDGRPQAELGNEELRAASTLTATGCKNYSIAAQ